MFNDVGGTQPQLPPQMPMWSPSEAPHTEARKKASPQPCNGACRGCSFAQGEGCNWCDYNPKK